MTRRQLWQRITEHLDLPLLAGMLMLMMVSLLTLYSASEHNFERVLAQGVNILVAFCCLWVVANLPLHYLMRTAVPIYVFGMVLLIGVALFGEISHGARRWLNIGVATIQPSELMKIGVPLMMMRFPDYPATFAAAGDDATHCFTMLEDARHNTNHTAVGCLLARNWGLSSDVSWAILLHHDYRVLEDVATDDAVRSLVALSLLAEKAIQNDAGHSRSVEWDKGGERACHHLGLSADDTTDLLDELAEMFNCGH